MHQLTDLHLFILERGTVTCENVTELLGDLVEGDLCATLHERVNGHINSCPVCQEAERSYRQVISLASELRLQPAPSGVHSRLMMALNDRLGLNLEIGE